MIEGSGSGSVSLTNRSGSGSPKTYGLYGSGFATLQVLMFQMFYRDILRVVTLRQSLVVCPVLLTARQQL
jgi:hypothetical protein